MHLGLRKLSPFVIQKYTNERRNIKMVKCKFRVTSKGTSYPVAKGTEVQNMVSVTMNPIMGDPVFGPYTPGGQFNATMVEQSADKLEVGKDYYIDITPVE